MINKKTKELLKKNVPTYNVWKQYDEFIRSLYLEKELKKTTGREKTFKFFRKLLIVFFGAFFTTLTFYFLIDPNGLYNSGLNGLIQIFSKLLVGYNDRIPWGVYYFIYYGIGLLINLFFIFILKVFFKAKLEIIITSIFYVFSQIIWTQLFKFANLREYFFNRFNPTSWQGIGSQSQSFTLPYYIIIALVAAVIHTYGYSLIFQAQATPGGLDILTSHFTSQKKPSFSISYLTKIFGFFTIFLVTVINFHWVENNPKMKNSDLQKDVEELKTKNEKFSDKNSEQILRGWENDMEKIKQLRQSQEPDKIKEVFEIREKNTLLTNLLKNKTGESNLEEYPQELNYYLLSEQEKINSLEKELKEIEFELSNFSGLELEEKMGRKSYLQLRLNRIKSKKNKSNYFTRYLNYITNNEKLWATVVYIFFSSFLISQIFPRDKIISLQLHSLTEEKRNLGIKILENHSPFYYTVYYENDNNEEKNIYIVNCYLSKWNYYLLTPHLKELGKIFINDIN